LRPLFKLVAQQGAFIAADDNYEFPVNALNLRKKEWEIFLCDSLHAVPLFRLKDGR
jgi:hypothetical protein